MVKKQFFLLLTLGILIFSRVYNQTLVYKLGKNVKRSGASPLLTPKIVSKLKIEATLDYPKTYPPLDMLGSRV